MQPATVLAGPQAGEERIATRRDPVRAGARSQLRGPVRWPWRAAGALSAALTAWWLCLHLLASPPIAPTAAALLAAAAVLVVPRLGLILGGLALVALAAAQGLTGGALLVMVVLAVTLAVMPTDGRAWTLPCGAVLLGTVSLAGAWPALLGRSGVRMWQRAAIAGAGYVWLASATAFTGTNLYAHMHPAFPAPAVWASSLTMTVHDVLIVMVDSGVLAGAAVWALSAALAPLLVSGRSLARDALLATLWAAATLAAIELSGRLLGSGGAAAPPRGAVFGAVLGAGILIAPALARARRSGGRGRIVPGRLP